MTRQSIPPLAPFEQSPITAAIADRLRRASVGEVISYEEISRVAGEDIHGAWHLLRGARESLQRERIVFGVITNEGVKRLDDSGKVAMSESYVGKVKSAAKRALKVLRTADLGALTSDEKKRYAVAEVRAGVAIQFTSKHGGDGIGAAVESGKSARDLRQLLSGTLKQFRS